MFCKVVRYTENVSSWRMINNNIHNNNKSNLLTINLIIWTQKTKAFLFFANFVELFPTKSKFFAQSRDRVTTEAFVFAFNSFATLVQCDQMLELKVTQIFQ